MSLCTAFWPYIKSILMPCSGYFEIFKMSASFSFSFLPPLAKFLPTNKQRPLQGLVKEERGINGSIFTDPHTLIFTFSSNWVMNISICVLIFHWLFSLYSLPLSVLLGCAVMFNILLIQSCLIQNLTLKQHISPISYLKYFPFFYWKQILIKFVDK